MSLSSQVSESAVFQEVTLVLQVRDELPWLKMAWGELNGVCGEYACMC